MATFRLHLDAATAADPAVGDEDQESIFPHTPRLDDRCFDAAVPEDLVIECVRPGSCAVPTESPERILLHRACTQLGHASNERSELLMAHSWFQCAYACKGSMTELLSSTNMRLNLGQWHLCRAMYAHILSLELTPEQRALTERKQGEASKLIETSGASAAVRLSAAEELRELLSAPGHSTASVESEETRKLLGLLRVCGHGANKGGDFEAAHTWFDCAFALCGATCDLLSAANMRAKLVPTSAVALAIYQHILSLHESDTPPAESHLAMAEGKIRAVEAARAARDATRGLTARTGGVGDSPREYF